MHNIKQKNRSYQSGGGAHHELQHPHSARRESAKRPTSLGKKYWHLRNIGKLASTHRKKLPYRIKNSLFGKWPQRSSLHRIYVLLVLILFLVTTISAAIHPFLKYSPYRLSEPARSLLPVQSDQLARLLTFDSDKAVYRYNEGYSASVNPDAAKAGTGDPRFTATIPQDPSTGVTVTDPVNQIDFTIKPKFRLGVGKKDQNQVLYRLGDAEGYLVYTAQIASLKEDIIIESAGRDRLSFDYELGLSNGLSAKLEKDGSVGIYGTDLPIYGNVSTGTEKDAELLQKVRENAPKTKLLFGIPAPVVNEAGKKESSVSAHFELNGNNLKVVAEGLKAADYPLSIDPSVFIESAAQLMRGNNESNVAFDVTNELFKKGSTTGARIDEWTETGAMNDATHGQSVAAAGGYVYRAGGRSGRVMPWIASKKETALSTTSTSFVMTMPDTRPAGDLYIAIISHDGTGVVTPPPSGNWTEYADTREHAAYYKVGENISGGNEASTYTWTGSNVEWAGVILRIKDFDPADIVSGTAATGSSGSAAVPVYPSVTPDKQGAFVVRAAGFNDDIPSDRGYSPSNHDDVASGHSGGGGTTDSGFVVSVIDSPPTSGVATGTATLSADSNVSDTYGASSIAINGVSATPAYQSSLQWARFDSNDGSIDSPTPSNIGSPCSGWCTNSVYNLPEARVGMSLVAYNGYLYALGGSDGANLESTVWVAKLGVNGEPSLWHPTDPNEATWVYWYADTGLSSARAYHSAYAYNGKMYVLGGDSNTTANSGAMTTVELADILPNGKLGSWSSGPALGTSGTSQRYDAAVQAYNGHIYVIGGNNNGTMISTATEMVLYSKINSDGTLNSWKTAGVQGSTFTTARSSHGGLMSGIWGAYIYLAGGCTVVNASGHCTTIASDIQLSSINADGTLDAWNTMLNLRHTRMGSSFIAWQDNLYRFGGCSKQDASNGDCYATHPDIQYGAINQDGDASTVSVTTASGSGFCTGNDPYDCNLPPVGDGAGQGGQMLSSTAILNGYLYVIGGCATFTCSGGAAVSGNVSYVAISSDGKLKQPPSCASTQYGAWCVDDVNNVNGDTGVAASAVTVFNGNIYVVGGLTGGGNVANIYRNTTNSDGSLAGAWTAQSFSNAGVTQNLSYTYAYSRANPASAGTYPGNLYIFGGCAATTDAGCTGTDYRTEVWKCNITTTGAVEEADANDCTTTGQLQIDSDAGTGGSQGLAIHAGTVYANYIYLLGGLNQVEDDLDEVRYAKFDSSNNVVAVSGGVWVESSVTMNIGRRRGTAFGYNGYLYAVGGFEATASKVLDTIEFVKLNVSDGSLISDNSKFTQSAVTISQRWGLALAVSNSFAYIIGGCNVGISPGGCSSFDPTIQTFQVYNNDSGAPGGYTTETDLFTTDRIGAGVAILNGYIYIAGGCVSSTDCTDATDNVQFAALDAYGNVGSWSNTTDSTLPGQRAFGQLEAAGGTLYFIGGQDDTSTNESADVYYGTPVSGNVSSWTDASNDLPAARTHFSSTVWNNRIYVTGGLDGSAAAQTTIYASPSLASGGNITSAWTTTGMTAFNVARSGHVAIAYANNLYILGGYTGSQYLSDVQFTQINTDGTLDSWTATTSLPIPLRQADGFASNGYIYLFGGRSSTNDCATNTLVAPISANTTIASGNNPTGLGEWYETNRRFDGGRYGASAALYNGKAYVLGGGCQGVVMQDDFDANYDSSQWSYTTNMSADTICQSTSTTNTFRAADGNDTTTYAATIDVNVASGGTVNFKLYIPGSDTGSCLAPDAPGFLSSVTEDVLLQYSINGGGAWTTIATYAYNQYDPLRRISATIPAGAQTSSTRFRWVYDPDAETGDMFAIEDVYIIANGSTQIAYTAANRVTYTTLLSQPQIAIYSRLIDADKDVTPTKWLINGLDNSIGARWQMRYRSMNDPGNTSNPCGGSVMTAYGQETNYGDVTLGTPATYTVKNGAGTDIGCGRFFFMTVSVDASQTYGYPDDVTRGPTLDNLTLFFNSNPGKRLIHGKTFLEGIQQPLDTQPGP